MIPHIPLSLPGKMLFAADVSADSVCILRAGCINTQTAYECWHEWVRGFFLPGDVVGLDAIGIGHYPENAVAVTA